MKKLFLNVVFIILIGTNFSMISRAQVLSDFDTFTLFFGDIQRFKSSVVDMSITSNNELLTVQNNTTFLHLFSRNKASIDFNITQDYTLPKTKPIVFYGDGKKSKLFNYCFLGDSVVGISSHTSFLHRKPKLYYHYIDPSINNRNNHGYPLTAINSLNRFLKIERIYAVNNHKKDYCAIFYFPITRNNEYSQIQYTLFKNDLSQPFTGSILYPFHSYEYKPLDVILYSKENYLFFAGHYPKSVSPKFKGNAQNYYKNITVNSVRNGKLTMDTLTIPHQFISDVSTYKKGENTFIMALTTSYITDNDLTGVLTATIDSTGKITSQKFNKIPFKKLIKNTNGNQYYFPSPNSGFVEFSKFSILELTPYQGGYVCAAELNAIEYRRGGTGAPGTSDVIDTHNWNGELIVFRIDKKGELVWSKLIPKIQRTVNDGGYYLSASCYLDSSTFHLFFNDNVENYDADGNYSVYKGEYKMARFNTVKNTIAHVSIQMDNGSLHREEIIGKNETSVVFVPRLTVDVPSEHKLLIFGQNGKKYRLGSIYFKE